MTSPANTALIRLPPRAEQNNPETLVLTFVAAGPLLTLLSSSKHQVMYGRRGTGKTHALQYLAQHVRKSQDHAVYIDLRHLGSTGGLYGDNSISVQQRATQLLVDVLMAITNALLNEILPFDSSPETLEPALAALGELTDTITQVRVVGQVSRETKSMQTVSESSSVGVNLAASAHVPIGLKVDVESKNGRSRDETRTEAGQEEHAVHFGSTAQGFAKLLQALPGERLWILLDEWSVIPFELQPLLADFIRRCLLPITGIVIKIATIEQRTRFRSIKGDGDYLGIELGADVSADVDFDDFMVFQNDAEQAQNFFKELFVRHLSHDPGAKGVVAKPQEFVAHAFTQKNAFDELVRAAEGVPRDAINIASVAALRAGDNPISVADVRLAARKWYQRDKEASLAANESATRLLHWIVSEVIGNRRARAFLVRSEAGRSDVLLKALFDGRLVHVIKKGISGGDVAGVRFDAFALDYGCYVDLMLTKAAPGGLFAVDDDELAAPVPKDDYRAIRRAILDLEAFWSVERGYLRA